MENQQTPPLAEMVPFVSWDFIEERPGVPYARFQPAGIVRGSGRDLSARFQRREIPIYQPLTPDAA